MSEDVTLKPPVILGVVDFPTSLDPGKLKNPLLEPLMLSDQ